MFNKDGFNTWIIIFKKIPITKKYVIDSKLQYFKPHASKIEKNICRRNIF